MSSISIFKNLEKLMIEGIKGEELKEMIEGINTTVSYLLKKLFCIIRNLR